MEKSISYFFKMMSEDIIRVCFSYIEKVDQDLSFQSSFILECRKIFPEIIYEQLKLFDKYEKLYNFDYIPDNESLFNVFIKERFIVKFDWFSDNVDMPIEYYNYYRYEWKGEMYKTYILWTENIKNKLKVVIVYCSTTNIIMTSYFDDVKMLCKRAR